MPRVITAGHVNWDVTLRVDRLPVADDEARIRSQRRSGGGSAANVAAALSALSVPTGIVGSVGDDEPGLLARRGLTAADVDTDGLRVVDGATTVKYLLVDDDGEVAVLANDGANEAIGPDDVDPDRFTGVEAVHLTGQRPDTAVAIADAARAADALVSVDPGRRVSDRDFSAVLDRADLVFLNDREATATDLADRPGRPVVTKRGEGGAVARMPDGEYDHPGFDVAAVDTAGAGDAFAAGYLAATLDDRPAPEALAVANACGALAAAEEGARTTPTREAVDRLLADGSR
ncbi:sugar kinase [Halobacteriales archaeon SW_7_68_16]|nr:MAG: sugar kinase [Halobacteriales archaeon SW_7_68_16]